MANVSPLVFPLLPGSHPTRSHICSGLGQKRLVVCYFLLLFPAVIQIISQLWNN